MRRRLVVACLKLMKSFGDRKKCLLDLDLRESWSPSSMCVQCQMQLVRLDVWLEGNTDVYLKILIWSEKGSGMFLFRHDL